MLIKNELINIKSNLAQSLESNHITDYVQLSYLMWACFHILLRASYLFHKIRQQQKKMIL